GYRRKLPEVGHQPGVRVRGEPAAVHFLTEVVQLFCADAAFEKRTCVDAGRRVTLNVYQVSPVLLARRVPEMIEPDVIQRRGRSETGDVTTQFGRDLVGAYDHRHRVPAHVGADTVFELVVARRALLLPRGNGIDVRGVCAIWEIRARTP